MSSYWLSPKGDIYTCPDNQIKRIVILDLETHSEGFKLQYLQQNGYIGIYPSDSLFISIDYIAVVPNNIFTVQLSKSQIDFIRYKLNITEVLPVHVSILEDGVKLHLPTIKF